MKIQIQKTNASDVRTLRHSVLRPGQDISEVTYATDEETRSGHFAAYEGGAIVGVATLLPEGESGKDDTGVWRLRGMAVLENCRGKGVGAQLLRACIQHAETMNAKVIWCTARTTVLEFYAPFGFVAEKEIFEIPGGGPHVRMHKKMDKH